ncbi:MAG: hypothetical protein ACK5KL_15035 [Dysgonomonas sp.]
MNMLFLSGNRPNGDISDPTKDPQFYDGTYRYLKRIGLDEI